MITTLSTYRVGSEINFDNTPFVKFKLLNLTACQKNKQ